MRGLFALLLMLCAGFFAYMMVWNDDSKKNAVVQPQAPFNAEKIVLVPDRNTVTQNETEVAVTEPPAVCLEWGEFSGANLVRAISALEVLNPGPGLSRRLVERTIGNWVYLAPVKTEAENDARVAQLKSLGVQDYLVIRDDEKWRNAISLGVFKTREAANRYRDLLTAKGVNSVLAGERTGKNAYTVFILRNPDAALVANMTLLQRDFPGSQVRAAACSN